MIAIPIPIYIFEEALLHDDGFSSYTPVDYHFPLIHDIESFFGFILHTLYSGALTKAESQYRLCLRLAT